MQYSSLCASKQYFIPAFPLSDFTVSFKGGSTYTGEVIIKYMGVNGRICSSGWDDGDANVVCHQFGFSHGISYTHYKSSFSYFGYTGPYWTSDVNCTGSETSLAQCLSVPLGTVKKCNGDHFAGALCFNNEGDHSVDYVNEGRNAMFSLTTHSTHFVYSCMA